jgi:hypothetical protein
MSTLKYRATGRYSMGWSDPRGPYGFHRKGKKALDMKLENQEIDKLDTQTLRSLWLAAFGDAPVRDDVIQAHRHANNDIFYVGVALNQRSQFKEITEQQFDRDETLWAYVLIKEA